MISAASSTAPWRRSAMPIRCAWAPCAGARSRPSHRARRYELSGHVLTLRGEDGSEERLSIFRGDPGSEGLLVIQGSNYLRREEGRR